MKQENIEVEATVISNNRNNFVVELDNGHQLKATLSGNMARHKISVIAGNRVLISISPHSMERGIIKRRLDGNQQYSASGNQRRRKDQKQSIIKKGRASKKKR